MRRTSFTLYAASLGLLLCLAAPAMARNGVNATANGDGSCPSSDESDNSSTERARQAAESRGKTSTAAPAKPSPRPAASSGHRASSGDDGAALRSHASRWHSFLPGMFR